MQKRGKLVIKTLNSKIIKTRFGDKEKWVVNDKWEAFRSGWNNDWQVGTEITAIFDTRQDGDKTYYDISCLPEMKQKGGGNGGNGNNRDLLEKILNEVVLIRNAMTKKPEQPAQNQNPGEPKDMGGPKADNMDDINIEDIPF